VQVSVKASEVRTITLEAFEAVGGDIVLCKCKQYPRASVYARRCKYIDTGDASAASAPASFAFAPHIAHDEQSTLRDGKGRTLAETYETVRLPGGKLRHGATDSQGRTGRYETKATQSIRIYLDHKRKV
jgi:hypothetical protein